MFDIWEIRLLRVYFCATALLAAPMTVECSVLRVEALQFAFDEGRLRFATEHCKDQSAISGQFLKSSQTFLQAMSQASGAPLALLEARQKEGYESAQKGPRLDDNACARMLKELPTLINSRNKLERQ